LELSGLAGQSEFVLGANLKYIAQRHVSLSQYNWNFFPPDAASNNLYIYQEDLNREFGYVSHNDREASLGTYASINEKFGRFELETGVRLEYFSNLSQRLKVVHRNRLKVSMGKSDLLHLFYGNFAESPVGRILEPYQVLIQLQQKQLLPVETRVFDIGYHHRGLSIEIFRKWISHLAQLTPQVSGVSEMPQKESLKLMMRSQGQVDFYGGDISLELNGILGRQLDLTTFYGYTYARKIIKDIAVPYELNMPHKFYFRIDYGISKSLAGSLETKMHSGIPFTPTRTTSFSVERYDNRVYSEYLQGENSAQFPMHLLISLTLSYRVSGFEVFGTVANLTNHDNAIINSADGYIHEAGILPILGMRYSF